MDQKLPMEAMMKPIAERTKSIQPMKLICLWLMAPPNFQAREDVQINGLFLEHNAAVMARLNGDCGFSAAVFDDRPLRERPGPLR